MVPGLCHAQGTGQQFTTWEDTELRAVISAIRTRVYDKIPAIDYPRFVSAERAEAFLRPGEKVIGVVIRKVAKAYPVKFLDGHEVVNDSLSRNPIMVTW
jgi:hypothetical protein